MKSLLSAYERYYQQSGLAAYAAVFELTNEKDVEASLCAPRLDAIVGRTDRIRILDIGCGLGAFTGRLISKLCSRVASDRRLSFECNLIDINPGAPMEFRRAVSQLSACDVHIGREIEGAWQHVAAQVPEAAYDVVVANHVFYGCPLNEFLVSSLRRCIAPGGVALVALVTRQSDLVKLRAQAGIPINTADDLGAVLNDIFGNYSRLLYDSKFRIDIEDDRHRDWLFASGTLNSNEQRALLKQYTRRDAVSDYIANRAAIFILEREAEQDLTQSLRIRETENCGDSHD